MSVDDLGDELAELRELKRRVDRLESGSMLENSSITRGRMRFIGGTLRVDSGGRVEIVGTLSVEGTTQFVGPVTISGSLDITGDTTITGALSIEGATSVIGPLTIDGDTTVNGSLDITGDTTVTGMLDVDGPWSLDGNGDITGDVGLTGSLDVAGGGNITVGDVLIDPQNGGRVVVDEGGRVVVRASETGQPDLRLIQGRVEFGSSFIEGAQSGDAINIAGPPGGDNVPARVTVNDLWAELAGGLGGKVRADDNGVWLDGIDPLPSTVTGQYLVIGDDGYLYTVAQNGGGDPGNPGTPGDNPGGYIYPVNPEAWTLGDDFQDHVARGSAEPGIDWWTSVGTPVWAPGDGTVVDVQTSYAGATGAYVTLVTDEGDWFRFLHNSSIEVAVNDTVTQGQVLAYTGGSGWGSPAGYGPHTHVSFKVGYAGVWPGGSALDDFLAYMA